MKIDFNKKKIWGLIIFVVICLTVIVISIINKKDLERVICVKPKLNNKRIIRQQGCFLLFGINEAKTSQAKLNEDWIKKDQNNEKFIIPASSKKHILNELKIFGISQNSLFPELESQAKEILEKYKK